jgi:hypothetical protein
MACAVVQANSNNLILAQLTDNDTDDIKPQVSGPYAVWQGKDPNQGDPNQGDPNQGDPNQGDPNQGDPNQGNSNQGDWEIYFYDGNDVMRLTDNNSDDICPQIDGPTVVWQGWDPNGGDWEIFYFDGNSVQQLTDNDQNDTCPQLSYALIVWQCWDGNDWEICSATIPLPVKFKFTPQSLNLRSRGRWVTGHLWLPTGYTESDLDTSSILLLDEVGVSMVKDDGQSSKATLKFDRAAVQALLDPGPAVEVTLTGKLTDGTAIAVSDIIKVIP